MKLKQDVNDVAVPREMTDVFEAAPALESRHVSCSDLMLGLNQEWANVLTSIRLGSSVCEMQNEREFKAATKAMLARHKLRVQSAKVRLSREFEDAY